MDAVTLSLAQYEAMKSEIAQLKESLRLARDEQKFEVELITSPIKYVDYYICGISSYNSRFMSRQQTFSAIDKANAEAIEMLKDELLSVGKERKLERKDMDCIIAEARKPQRRWWHIFTK
jgi:hypothetical protein